MKAVASTALPHRAWSEDIITNPRLDSSSLHPLSPLHVAGQDLHWDVICITARIPAHAEAYKLELQRRAAVSQSSSSSSTSRRMRRQCSGELPLATLVLAVGDPTEADGSALGKRIGSGGATLNALLLVAEHLSALAGESNVDMTALQGRRILVLHVGGSDQRMPAFSLLPVPPADGTSGTSRPLSTVDLLLEGLASLARSCPPGLFVVSSEDSFVRVGNAFHERFVQTASRKLPGVGTATAVASLVPLEAVRAHGVFELGEAGAVRRVHFGAPTEELARARLQGGAESSACDLASPNTMYSSRFAKVCGVVFFDEVAADLLLQLAFHPLFEACSYLGIDNGAQPNGFSLYLDLLASMGSEVSGEEFHGLEHHQRPSSIDGQVRIPEDMRAQLWKQFHGQVNLQAVVADIDDQEQYMSVRSTQDYVSLVAKVMTASPADEGNENDQSVRAQTFIDAGVTPVSKSPTSTKRSAGEILAAGVDRCACVVNSVLRACQVDRGAIIESSAMEACNVGEDTVCSGLKHICGITVPSGLLLQQISLLSAGTPSATCCFPTCRLQDEASRHRPGGMFLGQTWDELFHRSGITAADLWGEEATERARTLGNARLFPVVTDVCPGSLGLLWLEYAAALQSDTANMRHTLVDLWRRRRVQVWRAAQRVSFAEIMARADIAAEFTWQDSVAAETNVLRARHLLLHHRSMPLRQILDDETRRGRWGLLDVFDEIVAAPDTSLDVAARALGHIAEVLASFGGVEGGLRSGSARNPQWRAPLALLRSSDPAARREAVHQMKSLRTQWLHDGPVALIRAARHYEAAAQVLICTAVGSAAEFININLQPALRAGGSGKDVLVEAPARIDLAGGWTDTPPICYEHGGAVATLAVLVDGCRPIGAKARHLADCFQLVLETRAEGQRPGADADISAGSSSSTVTVCRCLADFDDHDSPNAPAALLKTCVLCAGVVVIGADAEPLEDQLRALGGGLHLVSWSRLPQGSGLGTSSILAAVVMKALLVALGRDIDDKSLIHAVLKVEQMLTTGGGWQDQVGGIIGGAKIARSAAALPLHVEPEELHTSAEFAQEINRRLVLVFTGRPRLAKYLLQNVIRQWFGRMPEICATLHGLVANAEAAAQALRDEDLHALGACIDTYWEQKRLMAPGCEPATVAAMRERLAPGLLGMTLAGAGGGGFAVLLTREPGALEWVRATLSGCLGADDISFHTASVDFDGLTVL